ncbi:hypothetical protein B5F74_02365 [Collinsella sp. An271]|uniref:tyrosine-type recombinase/integrase n=1 Tax=Collinsella sp. An271 TaxID=1965616 RepID=UPI000B368927|nr:site-specific integrase [Collinsella sp. An271]OUO62076.1 hypothetical protein B5F74_02365 [Collinsella sp. An271]
MAKKAHGGKDEKSGEKSPKKVVLKSGYPGIYRLEDKDNSKCRKWRLVAFLPYDRKRKVYPQRSKTVENMTLTEARGEHERFKAELACSKRVEKSDKTLAEYAKRFCDEREASGAFAEQTIDADRIHARQICHLIGDLPVQEIDAAVLAQAYLDLRHGKSLSGKELSGTTVGNIHAFVDLLMGHAVKHGLIAKNPCDEIETPRRDTKEKRALSEAELQDFISRLDPARSMDCAVLLAASLGLRRAEIVGLSWGDIDFAQGTVEIKRSYNSHRHLVKTKTEAGRRTLPLSDFAAHALRARYQAAGATGEDDPVIENYLGKRASAAALSSWWSKNRERLGVDGLTLHELRHTFLSILAGRGVHPAVMQRLAGHTDPTLTLGIYTHANLDTRRAAMQLVDAVYEVEPVDEVSRAVEDAKGALDAVIATFGDVIPAAEADSLVKLIEARKVLDSMGAPRPALEVVGSAA